jgi:hypothetical protein
LMTILLSPLRSQAIHIGMGMDISFLTAASFGLLGQRKMPLLGEPRSLNVLMDLCSKNCPVVRQTLASFVIFGLFRSIDNEADGLSYLWCIRQNVKTRPIICDRQQVLGHVFPGLFGCVGCGRIDCRVRSTPIK